MIFKTPAMRLSLGLVLMTINLIFLAQQVGLYPDASEAALEMRKAFSESLALQFSAAAERGAIPTIQNTLRAIVERNEKIRSAAIRTQAGELLAVAGEHLAHWQAGAEQKSTPTHLQVPVFRRGDHWATVEVRYAPLSADKVLFGFPITFLLFLLFVGASSLLAYFFILKRTLRELDPSAVIPDRVRNAFDVLQEGVLILDDKEQIIMANTAFAGLLGKKPEALVGVKGSELGWLDPALPKQPEELPWIRLLKADDGPQNQNSSLRLINAEGSKIKLAVNAACVTDGAGKCRGCLVTFDDMTQMEEKNFELNHLLSKLQASHEEIKAKSRELEFLANRDSLTLCYNRRALDRKLKALFDQAHAQGGSLCCVMADIDHFKSVNDRYGHATGDQVIKAVADVLKTSTNDGDLVGRYGGEEFCVVLTNVGLVQAKEITERMRLFIEKKTCAGVTFTASLGLAGLADTTLSPEELVNQADKALYVAKESGRNRVVVWGEEMAQKAGSSDDADAAAAESAGDVKSVSDKVACYDPQTRQAELERRIAELEGQLKKSGLELEHAILYDPHTGLPSRKLFEDRIAHEIARGQRTDTLVVVLAMTIAAIKRIEETMGVGAAHAFVKTCGIRLSDVLRENFDMVAFIEDGLKPSSISLINQTEFGILLPDIKKVDHVTWIMKRLTDAFERPFRVKGQEIYATPYLGVGIFPYDGQSVDELYSSAIRACRFAEQNQNGERYLFASQRINKDAVHQLQIETCLRGAIDNGELELHFQPQVEAASGRVAKFEALLRWHSPRLGKVPPDRFIPVAEYSGQIHRIGDWVIQEALKQLRRWLDDGRNVDAVAVNISGVQLRQARLAARVQEHLKTFGLEAHRLEIELTESSLVGSKDGSTAVLKQVMAAGVQVAIDDFGTGYSSLAYIKDIPLSIVKIDRSFTAGIGQDRYAEKLIDSIISMAHGLDLVVVAEGVESAEQADFLRQLRCEYLQGYYHGRPLPASAAVDYLDDRREIPSVA
jgi:diguanylate cyclase (GGDEF)-like protein/PAS domain S-box-containing protein